jgi:ferritin-like protein
MTQDEIIEMAIKAHYESKTWIDIYKDEITAGTVRGYLEAFAKLVAEKEREACAKAVEAVVPFGFELQLQVATIEDCAKAIRARGQA